jgi:ribosomal protein S27E
MTLKTTTSALLAGVLVSAALITPPGCTRKTATSIVHSEGAEHTEWPFAAWASARAYTYNFVRMNRDDQMTVYKGATRNPKVRSEHHISRTQATAVLERVRELKGTFMVSKCPFPRHAVVYFSPGGEPVGEIDVCFECGDVIAVPDYPIPFEERYRTDPKTGEPAAWPAYERLVDTVERLFSNLNEPIDWTKWRG